MPQNFENYSRRLQVEVDALAQEVEARSRFDHLDAFNFGRSVGRIEKARDFYWLRVRWLLMGAAAGVALAAVYLQIFLSDRILQLGK